MKSVFRYAGGVAVAVLGLMIATSASPRQAMSAPAAGAQAWLVQDIGTLSDKFVGLARVMSGKYDWRPMQGTRSVGEVFNMIVAENNLLAEVLLTGAPQRRVSGVTPITDATAMQEALRASYARVTQALSGLSEGELGSPVTGLQGKTKQGAIWMLVVDQHEHLGQSIAYTRSNMVVPPWSK